MLYIWPYITFFSLPVVLPVFLQGVGELAVRLPPLRKGLSAVGFRNKHLFPRFAVLIALTAIAAVVVHFNTIVHPFTLADNRHYTFYVFRLLLRHPATKYAVTPLYVITAWAALQTLGPGLRTDRKGSKKASSGKTDVRTTELELNDSSAGQETLTSFVIVWLLTSALSLVTAPLVEPRYFILPWVMWRLHVPAWYPLSGQNRVDGSKTASADRKSSPKGYIGQLRSIVWDEHDPRLYAETAWFVAINAVTGWIFLHWGFQWPQEPGNIQRFMW